MEAGIDKLGRNEPGRVSTELDFWALKFPIIFPGHKTFSF